MEFDRFRRRRLPLLLLAAANIVFTGATVLGWSGMQAVLDRERRYSSLCEASGDAAEEQRVHCDARAIHINLVYSVATFAFMAASLPLGVIGDRLGPRRTAMACNLAAGLGALVVAVPGRWGVPMDTFFVGMPLAAFFGPGLQVAFATVANLFPGRESTVIGVLSGMMGGSAVVFPVYSAFNAALPGASLSALFTAHAATCAVFAGFAMLFPPRPVPEAGGVEERMTELTKVAAAAAAAGGPHTRGGSPGPADPEVAPDKVQAAPLPPPGAAPSLLAVAASRPMRALLLLYVVHYLRLAFYLGTASLQLLRLADGDEATAASYLALLGWIAPFGSLAAPAAGLVDDARGPRFAMALVHALGIAHSAVALVPSLPVQVLGMALYTAQQEMFFAVGLARVLKAVPTSQFGVASGAFLLLGAVVSLLVTPLTALTVSAFGGNFTAVNAAFLVAALVATPAVRHM